jgi:hypothetical protein
MLCVNPEHLFLGSQKDNMRDMSNKKRRSHICGERCGNSKLSEAQVIEILLSDDRFSSLSVKYKVTYPTIKAIKLRRTWKHVRIPN